jgi:hypothetical protein
MSERNNPLTVYLTDEEKATLKKWADETGKSLSELGRDAVMEYTDHDRYDRVEGKLATILDEVQTVRDTLEKNQNAHTQDGLYNPNANTVPEKARNVVHHIQENHDIPIKDGDVELAIENITGVGDSRSINNYKEQFKKRGHLYEHPSGTVWTDDKKQWVGWVEGAYHNPDVYDVTEEYEMSTEEYIELVDQ